MRPELEYKWREQRPPPFDKTIPFHQRRASFDFGEQSPRSGNSIDSDDYEHIKLRRDVVSDVSRRSTSRPRDAGHPSLEEIAALASECFPSIKDAPIVVRIFGNHVSRFTFHS
jgi:hypothetical protein